MEMDNGTLEQYSRQMLVDEIGYDGQELLLRSQATIKGGEPWRSWALRYLTAAGLQAVAEDGDASNRLQVSLAPLLTREIWLPEELGAGLCRLGLELAAFLLDVVQHVGEA